MWRYNKCSVIMLLWPIIIMYTNKVVLGNKYIIHKTLCIVFSYDMLCMLGWFCDNKAITYTAVYMIYT